ncbi:TPA: restriction endonuclease subunit S [Serratia liquefaciens]|nr:restriction endonuclease subunit S [Serratia liquefaciens]
MFAKRYNADELIDIIAAPAYSPELIEYVKKVANAPYLSQFLSQKPKLGITGTIAKDYVSADTKDAVPYVSTKQVKGLHAYMDDAKYISKEADIEWAKCRVDDGDIIINKSGNVGAAAVLCCAPYKYVNSVSDIINIKLDKTASIDRDFLVVYLNSPYGQKQLQRLSGGAIFSHVSLHAIPDIRVYHSDIKAQKYIGDKVRQAEQLRAWAKRLENRVQSFHSQLIPDQLNLDFGKKTRKVSSDRMTERLDAHFYPGVVEQYLNTHPHKFESLNALTTVIYNGQTQPESFDDFCEQITVANLSASFIKGQPRKVSSPSKVDKFIKAHDILMCNAAHNKSYIGRELTYVHTDKKLLPSTEVMTVRVNRDLLPASFVRTYLLSRLGYVKVQSTIRGITAHSYPDDVALLDIYIPEVESNQKQQWFKQDELLVQAGCAVEFSQKLTSCAKILVEALIEGQLTEHQLIQAQQALEDGDNSLDQAILSKLSAEGYAIEGATPLFSDVDELYGLLEEAAQAEAEE